MNDRYWWLWILVGLAMLYTARFLLGDIVMMVMVVACLLGAAVIVVIELIIWLHREKEE